MEIVKVASVTKGSYTHLSGKMEGVQRKKRHLVGVRKMTGWLFKTTMIVM